MLYVRGGTQNNIIKITGEANLSGSPGVLGSTTLFDPRGIQGFPLNNCVEINIGGPQGALATKYSIPCVNSAMQIDNKNQYLGVNVAPLYPLDVQPLQPSAWTIAFSSTGTAPYTTGTGYVHSITVGGTTYSYTQLSGDTSAGIATTMAGLVNAAPDPNVTATINGIYVTLSVKLNTGARVVVSASDYNGSTTLTEDYQLVHNTARFFNAIQNTQLLLGHLRRHAPRYHLRNHNRDARWWRAGHARLLLSRGHHIADAATTVLRRCGGAAHGGDHALGQQERVEPGLVLLFRFPGMRGRERRSRSGFDDYRRGGRDRFRYG
jgi:hypothetical protein